MVALLLNDLTVHCFNVPLTVHRSGVKFAFGIARREVLAFVVLDFAFADGESHFYLAVFPIEGEGKRARCL